MLVILLRVSGDSIESNATLPNLLVMIEVSKSLPSSADWLLPGADWLFSPVTIDVLLPGADWLIDSCLVSPSPPIAQLPPGKQPKTTLLTLYKQNGQFFNPIWNEGLPLDSINFAVTRSNLHSTFCFHPFLPKKQFLWNNCYPKDLANWIRCWPNQVCLITINNSFHEKICCSNNKILKGRNKLTSSPTVPTVILWIFVTF